MRHVGRARVGSGTGFARHPGVAIAASLLALAVPVMTRAAEGAKVLRCIETVSKASWGGFQARESIAAIACQGVRDVDADGNRHTHADAAGHRFRHRARHR